MYVHVVMEVLESDTKKNTLESIMDRLTFLTQSVANYN